jgi:hypothetical protein
MQRLSGTAAALTIVFISALTLAVIGGVRSANADANARACVAQGFNANQCWGNPRSSF